MRADYDHESRHNREHCFGDVFDERSPADLEQRLGITHPARLARGQDDAFDALHRRGYLVRFRLPKRTPREKSSRSRVRRSRIISAMIETAISSGVSPPIATPSGACRSLSRSLGTPLSPSRSSVAFTRRREPTIPTNPHG